MLEDVSRGYVPGQKVACWVQTYIALYSAILQHCYVDAYRGLKAWNIIMYFVKHRILLHAIVTLNGSTLLRSLRRLEALSLAMCIV